MMIPIRGNYDVNYEYYNFTMVTLDGYDASTVTPWSIDCIPHMSNMKQK